MIPAKCVDASNMPRRFPKDKWVVEGEKYKINYVCRVIPQNVLAYSLYEKPLDKSCYPYEYFLATRFAVRDEDVEKIIEMYRDLGENISEQEMQELLRNSDLVPQK